jgi:hypothetical protein
MSRTEPGIPLSLGPTHECKRKPSNEINEVSVQFYSMSEAQQLLFDILGTDPVYNDLEITECLAKTHSTIDDLKFAKFTKFTKHSGLGSESKSSTGKVDYHLHFVTKYILAVHTFSLKEQAIIRRAVDLICTTLDPSISMGTTSTLGIRPTINGLDDLTSEEIRGNLCRTNWRFIKLSDDIEFGCPFTLDDIIFLPERFLKSSVLGGVSGFTGTGTGGDVKIETKGKVKGKVRCGAKGKSIVPDKHMVPSENLLRVLLHEKIHIDQRFHPEHYISMYRGWGFIDAAHIYVPAHLKGVLINNPDDNHDQHWLYVADLGTSNDLGTSDDTSMSLATYYWFNLLLDPVTKKLQTVAFFAEPSIIRDHDGNPTRCLTTRSEKLGIVEGKSNRRYPSHSHLGQEVRGGTRSDTSYDTESDHRSHRSDHKESIGSRKVESRSVDAVKVYYGDTYGARSRGQDPVRYKGKANRILSDRILTDDILTDDIPSANPSFVVRDMYRLSKIASPNELCAHNLSIWFLSHIIPDSELHNRSSHMTTIF